MKRDLNKSFKKELKFSIMWIFIYLISLIISNILSNLIFKIPNIFNAIFEIIFPIIIIFVLRKKGKLSYYGINNPKNLKCKNLLYFIPMILIIMVNLLFGIEIKYSLSQTILIIISMLGVGFSEEILFRSFLIKAIMNQNRYLAIIIPSIIFGGIHILNFIGGVDINLIFLQIIYATAFGFMCSIFFYKTNNIIPCMICHSLTNVTNIFLPNNLSLEMQYLTCILFIILSLIYSIYLLKTKVSLINGE